MRARAALDALFEETSQPQAAPEAAAQAQPPPAQAGSEIPQPESAETADLAAPGLKIPAELEGYLPPDTWRKLNSPTPRRGVLLNALERLRSIQYLVSTFLPAHLVQEKLRRPVPGLVSGQVLQGSLLFSDVSGFTAMSERLAQLGPQGAERLTEVMNRYFGVMLEILAWSGGILIKFAGDAMLVYFPEQPEGAQARQAARAGMRMLRAMRQFEDLETPSEKVSLRMKIGLASGEYLAASIGAASRMEYAILGPAVSRVMGAESASSGPGQLIVDEPTLRLLGSDFSPTPQAPGFFLVQAESAELGDFEIQAEPRRARSAITWNASPQALVAQMQVTVRQVQALSPYLATELVERVIAHAQQRQVKSEFRPTTVLFINFTGAEALLELWGAEGAARLTSLLSAYFNAMQAVIARYGGIVSRIDPYASGTKMLVLFGAPVSHEDDTRRAVSAALAMNLELEAVNDRLRQKFARYLPASLAGPLLQHRVGITCGITFAGQVGAATRREYTVMGDEVNLAARLMSAARPGQVLASPAVYAAVQADFIFTPLPPIRVKGKSKPIAVVQVDGPRDHTLDTRIAQRGPLVGRQAELARARELLERTLDGRPSLLVLQGPAGIGKSHLADAVLQPALAAGDEAAPPHPPLRLLSTQCQSYNLATPYAAWGSLLRGLAGITLLDLPQVYPDKLQRFVSQLELDPAVAASLGRLMGLAQVRSAPEDEPLAASEAPAGAETAAAEFTLGSPRARRKASSAGASDLLQRLVETKTNEAGVVWQTLPAELKGQERRQVYAQVLTLLERLMQTGPLVLFIEDAHWLDGPSQDLLRYAFSHMEHAPLFVLLARRSAAESDRLGAAFPSDAETGLASLGVLLPLAPLDAQGTHDLVASILVTELAQLIHQQSGGSPLLAEQITQWIQRTRKVGAEDLRQVLQDSDILQKLVLSSLETLTEAQRETARIAAVIGSEFRISELQAVASSSGSEVDPVTLSSHLRSLTEAQLLAMRASGVDARYAFQQSLVRDVLYNSLSFERRRALHGQVAQFLSAEAAARTGPASSAERRSAVHQRIAAFLEPDAVQNQAQQSERIAQHYELALQYLPAGQHLLAGAQQARASQDFNRAAALYQRGLDCLGKLGSEEGHTEIPALQARLLIGSADMALHAGNYSSALAAYQAARSLPSAELPAELLARLATCQALLLPAPVGPGSLEEAAALLASAFQTLPFFTQPEEDAAVSEGTLATTAALAWTYTRLGSPEAAAWLERSQALVRRCSGPWVRKVKALLQDLAGAAEPAQEAYLSLGLHTGAALVAMRRGEQRLDAQDFGTAGEEFQRAADLWNGRKKEPGGLFYARFRQAEVHWRSGEASAARSALNEAQGILPQVLPALRSEGRSAVRAAARLLDGKARKWPPIDWQYFEDAFYINLLFRI